MKVLIGVDGSSGSFEAIRQAVSLLAPDRDQVGLFYSPPEFQLRSDAHLEDATVERARTALARAVYDEARGKLPEALRGSVHEITGTANARHGLVAAADEWHADLIALGARGIGGVKELLLGSVAQSVAREASVPVLIVRPRKDARPLRLLLAADGAAPSRHAAEMLGRCTWPSQATGRIITVIEPLLAGEVPDWLAKHVRDADTEAIAQAWRKEHEAERRSKREEMVRLATTLPAPFQSQEPLVAEGNAAEEILKAIAQLQIDLVVVGARDLGRWERWLMGSTSEKVLAHAPCSVLVVRGRDKS